MNFTTKNTEKNDETVDVLVDVLTHKRNLDSIIFSVHTI